MPLKKVARKGKLDRDLPFRERKTFAIFPRRSDGWRNVRVFEIQGAVRDALDRDEKFLAAVGPRMAGDKAGGTGAAREVSDRQTAEAGERLTTPNAGER